MIRITFFGDLTLTKQDVTLSSKKRDKPRLFRALAYLLKERNRRVDKGDFARFLHEGRRATRESEDSIVKTTVHRLRELLAPFGEEETLILQDGGVWFSPSLTFLADTDRFDEILKEYESAESDERRRFLYTEAVRLYKGRYLAPFLGEDFVMPEAEDYHRRFLVLSEDALARMIDNRAYSLIIKLTESLTKLDPFAECFHYYRILALILKGDLALAEVLHRCAGHLFRRELHVTPSSRFLALQAHFGISSSLSADSVEEALQQLSHSTARLPTVEPDAVSAILSLIDSAHLLLVTGEYESLYPVLTKTFSKKAFLSRLSFDTLLVVVGEDDEAFSKDLDTLRQALSENGINALLDHKKYRRNN